MVEALPGDVDVASAAYGGDYNAPQYFSLGSDVNIRYLVDSRAIKIEMPDRTETFSIDQAVQSISTENSVYFEKRSSGGDLLTFLRLTAPIVNGVKLSYARYGTFGDLGIAPNGKFAYLVFGAETADEDMPRTGSASYNAVLVGVVRPTVEGGFSVKEYYLNDVDANFTADFDNMSVATSLLLSTTGGPATDGEARDFGTLAGSGAISASGPGFIGNFTTPGVTGGFTGAFFGPDAAEMGYVFNANSSEYVVTGNVFGEKDPFPPPPPPP